MTKTAFRWLLMLSFLPASQVLGCGEDGVKHQLAPQQLAMTDDVAPIYDDGQTTLYEVRLPVLLPLKRPSQEEREALRAGRSEPFPRAPFIQASKLALQVTWTLANLDGRGHNVEVLIDPWNEFGRYYPGLQIEDNGDAFPNLSGINLLRYLPGLAGGEESSRIRGVLSFDDMEELATDFATVINILENPPDSVDGEDDPRVQLVNYTFNIANRHNAEVSLTKRYLTELVPGLIGFDVGLRTTDPANIAIEFSIELVDYSGDDVVIVERNGDEGPSMQQPDRMYTLGAAM